MISDHTSSTKARVKIMTVDPPTRRIEGVLKDGSMIQIAVWDVPNAFRWPQEGETWLVHKQGTIWVLDNRQQQTQDETSQPVTSMSPGQMILDSTDIITADASKLVISLPAATGNANTDTQRIQDVLSDAKATGAKIIAPVAPWPGYVINSTLQVPSGMTIEGAGEGATFFTPATGFAGPVFEVQAFGFPSTLAETSYDYYGQGWFVTLRGFSVQGNVKPPFPAMTTTPQPDNRQVADGIWIHDSDWIRMENVSVGWLAGYGLKLGPGPVRESSFSNVHLFRCGNSTTSKGSLHFSNSSAPGADQNNLLAFDDIRILYPHWIAVYMDQSGINFGNRLIYFRGGGIEAGGYGGSPGTMLTTGNAFPYDLVYLGNALDVWFEGTELAQNSGQKLVNCVGGGSGQFIVSLKFSDCNLVVSGASPGIYADQVNTVVISGCHGGTIGSSKVVTNTANNVRTIYTDTNSMFNEDTGLRIGLTDFNVSANPIAFYGPPGYPTVTAGAEMGTAPPAMIVECNDAGGVVAFGTGTTPASGYLFQVTFANPMPLVIPGSANQVQPGITITAFTGQTAALGLYMTPFYSGSTILGFQVACTTLPAASQSAGTYGVFFSVLRTQNYA